MKKDKVKSENKKAKKELVEKLTSAFTTIVADYGKAKKTTAIIEKFAKQLSKKIDIKSKEAVIVEAPKLVKEQVVKVKPVKKIKETAE